MNTTPFAARPCTWYTAGMDLEPLRATILRLRAVAGMTQEDAADAADVSLETWKNLEMAGNTRRTAIRVPHDMPMLDRVANALGVDSGWQLLIEAGVVP